MAAVTRSTLPGTRVFVDMTDTDTGDFVQEMGWLRGHDEKGNPLVEWDSDAGRTETVDWTIIHIAFPSDPFRAR